MAEMLSLEVLSMVRVIHEYQCISPLHWHLTLLTSSFVAKIDDDGID